MPHTRATYPRTPRPAVSPAATRLTQVLASCAAVADGLDTSPDPHAQAGAQALRCLVAGKPVDTAILEAVADSGPSEEYGPSDFISRQLEAM